MPRIFGATRQLYLKNNLTLRVTAHISTENCVLEGYMNLNNRSGYYVYILQYKFLFYALTDLTSNIFATFCEIHTGFSALCSELRAFLHLLTVLCPCHLWLSSFGFGVTNCKGAIIFYREGGGRLSVIAGRQFFLVPPLACAKKFWSPPRHVQKNSGPPLGLRKKILVPPLVKEHPLT